MSGIILNEDFENFMASNPPEKMTAEGLCEQIDHYADSQVEAIIFCGNGMRAMFPCRTVEPLWTGIEERADGRIFFRNKEVLDTPLPVKRNALNCRRLCANVPDPYKVRIEYGRKKGVKIIAGMRMNDVHWASDPDFLMHSNFWREHPEYRRTDYQFTPWYGQGLDYAVPEVRRRSLALVKEYLFDHDFDGIELDWMRTPPHFKPGFEAAGIPILNEFMRQVREIADEAEKRHGHKVSVYVRVPISPVDCRRNGMDVPCWVREKWVDHVTVTCYYFVTDFDPPLELWRMLLGDEISLAAGLDINIQHYPGVPPKFRNTEMIIAGFAASFFYRGADSLYLFNHMDGAYAMYDRKGFRRMLENCGERSCVEPLARRHIVTYSDRPALGLPRKAILPLVPRNYAPVRINAGGATAGRKAFVILFGKNLHGMEVRLNTFLCSECGTLPPLDGLPESVGTGYAWKIPENALHDGDNVLEFNQKDPGEAQVTWCEIYLPAKE